MVKISKKKYVVFSAQVNSIIVHCSVGEDLLSNIAVHYIIMFNHHFASTQRFNAKDFLDVTLTLVKYFSYVKFAILLQ